MPSKFTTARMKKVSKRLNGIYKQASEELTEKVNSFFADFERLDKQKAKLVESGKMSEREYKEWRKNKLLMGKKYEDLRDTMVERMTKADEIATAYMNGELPAIYAHNFNQVGKDAEAIVKGYSFDLVNEDAVCKLSTSDKTLLPYKIVDGRRTERWHTKRVNSAILQGILQGEGSKKIAQRLMETTEMGKVSAMRNARTALTGAQNKGREDAMGRLAKAGLPIRKKWMASTGDGRTRPAHLELHEVSVPWDKPFENALGQIMYPGDPNAHPSNVYNCRCSLVTDFSELLKDEEEEEEEKEGKSAINYSTVGLTEFNLKRPRVSDFDDEDAYYEARDQYRAERDAYKQKVEDVVDKALSVKRFNSKEEILEWAKSNNIQIDSKVFEQIDIRAMNETSIVLDEMFRRFPEIKGYDMEDIDGSMFRTGFKIGVDDMGLLDANGGLNFNPRLFADYSEGLREAFNMQIDGYIVRGDGTFGSLIRHEYGHNVQEYVESKIREKYHRHVQDWRISFDSFEEYKQATLAYKAEQDKYDSELLSLAGLPGSSQYSNTNTLELFAEGFAAWSSGQKTEFALKFGEFLQRWYP